MLADVVDIARRRSPADPSANGSAVTAFRSGELAADGSRLSALLGSVEARLASWLNGLVVSRASDEEFS